MIDVSNILNNNFAHEITMVDNCISGLIILSQRRHLTIGFVFAS